MRFLADMNVDVRVVEWLRNRGHDAVHLRDEGLHRLPNGEIFRKAMTEDRTILAFDLDFGELDDIFTGYFPLQQLLVRIQSFVDSLNHALPCFAFFNVPVNPLLNEDFFQR